MRSVELFAGCGGLALGLSRVGFKHRLVVELDDRAFDTLAYNKRQHIEHFSCWPLKRADVCDLDYGSIPGEVDLVSGGPPCQPFSIGGKHLGHTDPRNMWPEAIRAVRALRPKAFVFENVRGLLRPAFERYLRYITLSLSWPELANRKGESWFRHYRRLKQHDRAGKRVVPMYRVQSRAINVADYGAPQKRNRAIIMGVRKDIAEDWDFPNPTHSRDALIWSQYIAKDYWTRHSLKPPSNLCAAPNAIMRYLTRHGQAPDELPWVTVRDAISDLPDPVAAHDIQNHDFHPGARVYRGHTGSRLDEPAKALKAGDHGVPGGENILALDDGSVRYFTLREMARLQGFPDDFVLLGSWKGPIKQIGNAVPVQVGEAFGGKIAAILRGDKAARLLAA